MTPKEVIEFAGEEVIEDAIADLHDEIGRLHARLAKPIDMILNCPHCELPHIDATEPGTD
jgi:hypothetical protein